MGAPRYVSLMLAHSALAQATTTFLCISALGCGGKAVQAEGSAGTIGSAHEPSGCVQLPAAPVIDFQSTCDSFIPSLSPSEVIFVERSIDASAGLVGHRFRSTKDCGFDVVISLPRLKFDADEQPYELSTWWLRTSFVTDLLVVILRRAGDRSLLLGVATSGSTFEFNSLASPLAVTLNGPGCTDSAESGVQEQVVELEGVALPCENDAAMPWLRLCRDGDTRYRMVDYPAQLDSTTVPAVLGDAKFVSVTE